MKGTPAQFDFANLPQLSRRDLEIRKQFPNFHVDEQAFNGILGAACTQMDLPALRDVAFSFIEVKLRATPVSLAIEREGHVEVCALLSDHDVPCLLTTPSSIAKQLVYALLGSQDQVDHKSEMTMIEVGVFRYIVASLLSSFNTYLSEYFGRSVRFIPLSSLRTADEHFCGESHVIDLAIRLKTERSEGTIRLLVAAHPALGPIFQDQNAQEMAILQGITRVEGAHVDFSVKLGEITLQTEELESLKVDDIVIVERSQVKRTHDSVEGIVELRLGESVFEGVTSAIFVGDSGRYALRIEQE